MGADVPSQPVESIRRSDRGSATVEFVAVAIAVLVPLMYVVLAVFDVQREVFASTQAAREAGRALETAAGWQDGVVRARVAARLAYADHGIDGSAVEIFLAPSVGSCSDPGPGGSDLARGRPGTPLDGATLCVRRTIQLPGVPAFLDAGRNTVNAGYVIHLSRYREWSE